MKKWILKKLLKNYGEIYGGDIQRSGQPGRLGLWLHYKLKPFKSVINLAWSPGYDSQDSKEESFCHKKHIEYVPFAFSAGGPHTPDGTDARHIAELVLGHIDRLPKPVWVHCEGGKDRTGGIIMRWTIKQGIYTMEEILGPCELYGTPAEGWLRWALEGAND